MDTFYFVSEYNFGGQTLYPRIPANRMTNENNHIKRICVSKSINGCLSAIGGFEIGDIRYVYFCNIDKEFAIQPDLNDVGDSCLTGEEWIIKPVKMEHFQTIKINGILKSTIHNMSNDLYSFETIA